MESQTHKFNVIIFGGSSFMGLTTLMWIANKIEDYNKVYVLNRGKKYWGGKSLEIMAKHSDVFEHIIQDRDKPDQFA